MLLGLARSRGGNRRLVRLQGAILVAGDVAGSVTWLSTFLSKHGELPINGGLGKISIESDSWNWSRFRRQQ